METLFRLTNKDLNCLIELPENAIFKDLSVLLIHI